MADKKEEKQPSIWDSTDVKILYEGKKFVLPSEPEKMDFDSAIDILKRCKAAEDQRYDVHELIEGAPWDALVAVAKSMQQIYGVVLAQSVQTFFGEIKPQLITVNTGPEQGDNIQVAAGQMSLPNITAPVNVHMVPQGCLIMGTVKRKDRDALVKIATLARHIMSTESIYKGKAIHLHVDDDGDLELNQQPDFIQLKNVQESDMIHTAKTAGMISTNIFGPLKHTEACRRERIPLKRGILLSGKYGTGKSLTARVTAKVAIDNGWTFIMLARSQGLKSAIEFAKNYQPCVIFAEDIDRAADREDEDVNTLVNLLDGLITKDMEMMVVLTTNFVDKIDKALLRPGRFDAVITIQPPDAETAIKLVHQYGRDLISSSDAELTMPSDVADGKSLGELLDGQIPATIREVVERAKLSMLMESRTKLSANDLIISAVGMNEHIALLADKPVDDSPEKKLWDAMHDLIASAADFDSGAIDGLNATAERIGRGQRELRRDVANRLEQTQQFAMGAAESAEKAREIGKETLATTQKDLRTTEKVAKAVGAA